MLKVNRLNSFIYFIELDKPTNIQHQPLRYNRIYLCAMYHLQIIIALEKNQAQISPKSTAKMSRQGTILIKG